MFSLKYSRLYCALAACAVIIFCLAFISFRGAFAKAEPSLQAKAAADLPRVISVLEENKAAYDRYVGALAYKARLVACVDQGDCSVFPTR